jgi:FkbM family methyltransferase
MIRALKNRIRDKIWIFLKAKWQLRSGIAIVIQNDSDWFVYNEIFCNKEYDDAINLFLKNVPVNPLIVDLGANVGYFALKMADELKFAGAKDFQIVSLEASPLNFTVLQQRVQQPALSKHVKAYVGMAGYKTGSESIGHSAQHYGHSTFSEKSNAKKIVVDYVNIETLLPVGKTIDFLKCDIEGSEEIFIKEYNELLMRTNMAVFEWHEGVVNVEHCRTMLQELGFRSKGILKEDPPFKTSVEMFQRI